MPKNEKTHNHTTNRVRDFLLLFSVPLGVIILLIGFVYLPRLLANPMYDFVYCSGFSCDGAFTVTPSGKIIASEDRRYYDASLQYYDVSRDASRPIQLEEAAKYQIDPLSKSPDGYIVRQNTSGGGILFLGNYKNDWSLKKGFASKPISLDSHRSNTFIGWVRE